LCTVDALSLTNIICDITRHEVGPFYLDVTLKVGDKEVYITSIVNFVSPLEVGCANCKSARADHHTVTTATLISPKLRELYEEGELGGLVSSDTEAKLAENLKFTCYTLGVRSETSPMFFHNVDS